MIRIKDYGLVQYPLQNQIIISLPQTEETISNTVTPIVRRRKTLTEEESAIVLELVIAMLEEDSNEMDKC